MSLCLSLYHGGLFDSSSHLVFICVFIAASVNLKSKNDLGLFRTSRRCTGGSSPDEAAYRTSFPPRIIV